MHGITESFTDPPAVPPANWVGYAGGRWPACWCGGGSIESTCVNCRDSWLRVGRVMMIAEHNYVIIDGSSEN